LNTFNHFKTETAVSGFGNLDIHFLHHRSPKPDAIPLLFVHGWYVISMKFMFQERIVLTTHHI
jgi:hypothetical protein